MLPFLLMELRKAVRTMMNVLAINSGSSSLKFKVVEFDESLKTAAARPLAVVMKDSSKTSALRRS